ncbi:MAG: hypothetical protein Q4P33_05235 [Flaviflexus sp.]|nr:hypothetical protein [Flaviflexus sp.]
MNGGPAITGPGRPPRGFRLRIPTRRRPLAKVRPAYANRFPPGTIAQSPGWHYPLLSIPFFYAAYILFLITWPFAAVDDPIWPVLLFFAGFCAVMGGTGVWLWLAWLASFFVDGPDRFLLGKASGKVVEYAHRDITGARVYARTIVVLKFASGKRISVNLAAVDAPHLLRHLVLISARTEPPHVALNLLSDLVYEGHLPHPPVPLDQTIYQLATTGIWPAEPVNRTGLFD